MDRQGLATKILFWLRELDLIDKFETDVRGVKISYSDCIGFSEIVNTISFDELFGEES